MKLIVILIGSVFGLAAVTASVSAFAADIEYKDLEVISNSARVKGVSLTQIGAPPAGTFPVNPTVIELKIKAEGHCYGPAIDLTTGGRIAVVDKLPSAGFPSGACEYSLQYVWAPQNVGTAVGSTWKETIEIGPVPEWKADGNRLDKWYKVSADVTHKMGTVNLGYGHYYEYANVTIVAP